MENDSHFYYFGYASNLKISILEQRIGDRIQNYMQGRLIDYGFRFNKKNADGSARANIIVSDSEDVFGVVFEIEKKYHDVLFKTEPGYRLINVSVETEQGNVQAITFISDADDEDIYPTEEYLNSILTGAKENSLPREYTDFIRSMAI